MKITFTQSEIKVRKGTKARMGFAHADKRRVSRQKAKLNMRNAY